jgi:DNA modification methylase
MQDHEDELQNPIPKNTVVSAFRDRIRELRRVKAADLRPNPKNWRKHPKVQADALRGVLSEIGQADALLVRELPDGTLMIIDGHLRAETMPDSIVAVLVLDVTEEEADKLLLTIDPLAAMAESDPERMASLLKTVRTNNEAVQELLRRTAGNRLWEKLYPLNLDEATVSSGFADTLQEKWDTKPGQFWQAGAHRVICGDSRDPMNVVHLFKDGEKRFRTIWCDPPYGVDYSRKNEFLNARDRGNRIQKPIANDENPDEAPEVFSSSMRVAIAHGVRGASAYACAPGGPLLPKFIAAFDDSGFSFRASLVWSKQQFVIGRSDYQWSHENVLYGWIENGAHYFIDDRTQRSVFEVDKPHVSAFHATQKPIELISKMIANSSRSGEVVYDPFAGSGSTLVAAHQLGRIGYGCEIDPAYLAVVLERLSMCGLKPELVR